MSSLGGLPCRASIFNFRLYEAYRRGREFYVAMCPLAVIPKVFAPDESSQRAHERGQRILNKSRVPKLARFLLEKSARLRVFGHYGLY